CAASGACSSAPWASYIWIFSETTVSRPTCIRTSGAQSFHQVENFRGVAARVDAVFGVADDALLVDDEGGAHQALAPHAVLGLLVLDDAVLAAHVALGVGEQADGDAVAVAEISVREAVVARHAEHHAVVLDELLLVVGKISGDQRASGRAVLGIEVEHYVLLSQGRHAR